MSKYDQTRVSGGLPAGHEAAVDRGAMGRRRQWSALAAFAMLCLAFLPVLSAWFRLALGSDLHSHVILIPGISVYLLVINYRRLAWDSPPSVGLGIGVMILSGMILTWRM